MQPFKDIVTFYPTQMAAYTKIKKDDDMVMDKAGGADSYIFDPYNSVNKEITQEDVQAFLAKYNVHTPIHHFVFYKRAFVHRSYTKRPEAWNQQNNITLVPKPDDCHDLYTKSNERLEFLGDGVLECIAKFYLYKRFPKADEGFMTDTKIELVKNETIGRIVMELGLNQWFMLSKHTEQKNLRTNHKKLGCLFEAFVGALFLDFNRVTIHDEHHWFDQMFQCGPGFQVAQLFVEAVFDRHIDWTKITKQSDNFKRPLQELLQSEFKTTPHIMEIESFTHEQGYHMGVYLCLGQATHGVHHSETMPRTTFRSFEHIHQYMARHQKIYLFLGSGINKIKIAAEQTACKDAIEYVKSLTDFQEVIDKVQQKHNAYI
jgi:dsRNA-specific ribonuclease